MSFDPGLRVAGVALFECRILKAAALIRNPEAKVRGPQAWNEMAAVVGFWVWGVDKKRDPVDVFISEVPRVYYKTPNPADLIELAGVVGAVSHAVPAKQWRGVEPAKWKGSRNKDHHNAIVISKLAPTEEAAIEACPAYLKHNVVDAVGLGLFALGR